MRAEPALPVIGGGIGLKDEFMYRMPDLTHTELMLCVFLHEISFFDVERWREYTGLGEPEFLLAAAGLREKGLAR